MRVDELKEYIVDNNCIETILEDLGCGHIRERDGYFTCSNPDGNNPQAVTVYNNESLITVNYTRNITKHKRVTDIFDLVSFYKDYSFPEALKYVHEVLGLNYYSENKEVSEGIQILIMLEEMMKGENYEENEDIDRIFATIHVEHDSQKGIMIGRKGQMLKTIGMQARTELEKMLEKKVYLELTVKVSKDWRKKKPDFENWV